MGATGRGDTVFGYTVVLVSLTLVLAGTVALLTVRHRVGEVREQLSPALAAVAAHEHRGPRDPRILPEVERRLPGYVHLQPSVDYARTGRLLIRWHRGGASGSVCVVVPARSGAPLTSCRSRTRPA